MYSAFMCMLLLACWEHVISQSTWAPDQNNKGEQCSSETKVLLEKIISVESDISRLKEIMPTTDAQPAVSENCTWRLYCDMNSGDEGWLVFQRRKDGSESFYRNWTEYKNGFGRLDGEFWLGNDFLAGITNTIPYELRVDLEDARGNKAYAIYSEFSIAGEEDNYRLSLGHYLGGTAGDSLSYHNSQQFSTYDRDNDQYPTSCVKTYNGAWWHNSCYFSSLNGQYYSYSTSNSRGIVWRTFKEYKSMFFTEMKMRPK